jgi:protein ImuB
MASTPPLACVDIPAFPLQLVLRAHPEWSEDPVVVVEEERPLAEILWANRIAKRHRIHRGMKFSQAQSLTARLHAEVVSEREIQHALSRIFVELLHYSPSVEPWEAWPGVFWVDPAGLETLYQSLQAWAEEVHRAIATFGFVGSVVLGWERCRLLALAQTNAGPRVVDSPETEKRESARVPLARLNLSTKLLAEMTTLGVQTLGDFLALPNRGLLIRYGKEAAAFHDLASGKTFTPLKKGRLIERTRAELVIDPPDDDTTRLLFGIKNLLHGIVVELEKRSEGITALEITLCLDHTTPRLERLEPSAPTRDVVKLVDLVRLRLAGIDLEAPVESIRIDVKSQPVHAQRISLFPQARKRDLEAASAALARVKAFLGPLSVTRAKLENAWLPEKQYRWEASTELSQPCPHEQGAAPPLVRSLLAVPLPLPDPPRHETEAWLGRKGAVATMSPPARVATNWWATQEERDYYFVETRTGEILWIFYDRVRRSWFLHGTVE